MFNSVYIGNDSKVGFLTGVKAVDKSLEQGGRRISSILPPFCSSDLSTAFMPVKKPTFESFSIYRSRTGYDVSHVLSGRRSFWSGKSLFSEVFSGVRNPVGKIWEERKVEKETPLFGKIEAFFRSHVGVPYKSAFAVADASAAVDFLCRRIWPGVVLSSAILQLVGGIFSGLALCYLALESGYEAFVSFSRESYERCAIKVGKVFTFCSGITTSTLSSLQSIYQIAHGALNLLAMSVVSSVFLIKIFLISTFINGYKAFVEIKFNSDLNKILNQPNKDRVESLRDALIWLKASNTLSKKELSALEARRGGEGIKNALHVKWDRFSLRAGSDVYPLIGELLDERSFAQLLKGLSGKNQDTIEYVEEIFDKILLKNQWHRWRDLSLASLSLVGLVGTAVAIALAGPFWPLAFGILCGVSVFVSSNSFIDKYYKNWIYFYNKSSEWVAKVRFLNFSQLQNH